MTVVSMDAKQQNAVPMVCMSRVRTVSNKMQALWYVRVSRVNDRMQVPCMGRHACREERFRR